LLISHFLILGDCCRGGAEGEQSIERGSRCYSREFICPTGTADVMLYSREFIYPTGTADVIAESSSALQVQQMLYSREFIYPTGTADVIAESSSALQV
jgi:mannitol/fructose-specific phosphotransferase system IIA component (Ntr-type)